MQSATDRARHGADGRRWAETPAIRVRKKKARHEAGLGKFGRGCLKGTVQMPSLNELCKCESGIFDCKERNLWEEWRGIVQKVANYCLVLGQSIKKPARTASVTLLRRNMKEDSDRTPERA